MNTWKTWSVRFSERNFYTVVVKARSEDDALARAGDLYDRFGPVPDKGFCFDISEGGTDDWSAEVAS